MARKDFLASSRKLRRKRLILKAVVMAVIFFAIFAGIVAFFRMPYSQVEKIEISGNILINGDDLIEGIKAKLDGKYFGLFPKANIFIIPKDKILTELTEDFKRIKNISLDKKYFGGIAIKIEERNNAVLFCEKEDCAYADESGFVFEKAPYFSGAVFLKLIDQRNSDSGENAKTIDEHLGSNLITESEFKKILEFAGLTRLDSRLASKRAARLVAKIDGGVSEVILKKENIYEFYMQEGWKIILNDKNEPQSAYLNLITVLDINIKDKRQKLDYINLRLGNKIYFKYK